MHEETLFILKEKFKALEQSIDINEHTFCKAALEYSSYIGNTQYLSDFVKQMGLEHDIHPKIFYQLFFYSTLKTGFKNQHLKQEGTGKPLFWCKEIEAEHHLFQQFLDLLSLEEKRLQASKAQNVSVFDILLPEDGDETNKGMSNEEELFEFRILHNEILTRASLQKKSGVLFDSDNGILQIGEQTVKFRKFTEQFHSLSVIFSKHDELDKEWMFSELAELIDGAKYTDKDFHNYFSAIKRRVAAEAGVKDLFITTNQSVKINRDYL